MEASHLLSLFEREAFIPYNIYCIMSYSILYSTLSCIIFCCIVFTKRKVHTILYKGVSENRRPQNRTQPTMILLIGTPQKGP